MINSCVNGVLASDHKLPQCTPCRSLHASRVQPVGRSRPLTFRKGIMNDTPANLGRVLGNLKRLMREGDTLLDDPNSDELSHALWGDRVTKYISKKMPYVQILRVDELVPIVVPDLMDQNRPIKSQIESARIRLNSMRQLSKKYLAILASAIERLELHIELNGK
jgi:hypothetical protein